MIENVAPYLIWSFTMVTLLTVGLYLCAVLKQGRERFLVTGVVLGALLALHGALAYSGFYLTATVPPRFFLGFAPTTVILLVSHFYRAGVGLPLSSLRMLTLLSVIRIPVEVILLGLYRAGYVPELMTFEGRNFDLLSGLTAPLVAWFAFSGGAVKRPLLIGWNLLALGLVLNVLIHAILALEGPFQQLAFDQPNRGVLYFPFIWLPAIIVPIVLVSHVASLWDLIFYPDHTGSEKRRVNNEDLIYTGS